MTDARKLAVFDSMCVWIAEHIDEYENYDEALKETFLDLGFTEEEYTEEMVL